MNFMCFFAYGGREGRTTAACSYRGEVLRREELLQLLLLLLLEKHLLLLLRQEGGPATQPSTMSAITDSSPRS